MHFNVSYFNCDVPIENLNNLMIVVAMKIWNPSRMLYKKTYTCNDTLLNYNFPFLDWKHFVVGQAINNNKWDVDKLYYNKFEIVAITTVIGITTVSLGLSERGVWVLRKELEWSWLSSSRSTFSCVLVTI